MNNNWSTLKIDKYFHFFISDDELPCPVKDHQNMWKLRGEILELRQDSREHQNLAI